MLGERNVRLAGQQAANAIVPDGQFSAHQAGLVPISWVCCVSPQSVTRVQECCTMCLATVKRRLSQSARIWRGWMVVLAVFGLGFSPFAPECAAAFGIATQRSESRASSEDAETDGESGENDEESRVANGRDEFHSRCRRRQGNLLVPIDLLQLNSPRLARMEHQHVMRAAALPDSGHRWANLLSAPLRA